MAVRLSRQTTEEAVDRAAMLLVERTRVLPSVQRLARR
jgi:hypothetical protein